MENFKYLDFFVDSTATITSFNVEPVVQFSTNTVVRVIADNLDVDEISLSILQVNGTSLARKYLLFDGAAIAGKRVWSYRLNQTDTAIANPQPSNMKFTFRFQKGEFITTTAPLDVQIIRTNRAEIVIPEDSSLSGFTQGFNRLSDQVENLAVEISEEFYATDVNRFYQEVTLPAADDKILVTRGITPRFITASSLASALAIAGPQGPSGEQGPPGQNGANGDTGSGLVFRGDYNPINTYRYDDLRREVVFHELKYYAVKVKGSSTTGPFNPEAWNEFTGAFDSIATGLLLTRDAAITRSLVLGTAFEPNVGEIGEPVEVIERTGVIRSADASNINSGVGFYFDGTGKALIGNTAGNYIRWNGTNLEIAGNIVQATISDPNLLEQLKGEPGQDGQDGTSVSLKGSVQSISNLPSGATEGDLYVVLDDGNGYIWSGSSWNNVGPIRGPQGTPGQSGRVFIAYAESPSGLFGFSTTVSTGKSYLGQYVSFNPVQSTNPGDYTWSKILGDTGLTGPEGPVGPRGDTGPGFVFRGVYDQASNYSYTETRRDVVLQNNLYYTVKNFGTTTGVFSTDNWQLLNNFSSVATDLLLANNATITKGLVMGTAQDQGFIRSFGTTSLTNGNGFFLNGDGRFLFGNSAGNRITWDGTNLVINGTASFATNASYASNAGQSDTSLTSNAVNGTIAGTAGGWTIDNDAIFTGVKQNANNYTTSGITLHKDGALRSPNFRLDTTGGAFFRGAVEATSGKIGNLNITTQGDPLGPGFLTGFTDIDQLTSKTVSLSALATRNALTIGASVYNSSLNGGDITQTYSEFGGGGNIVVYGTKLAFNGLFGLTAGSGYEPIDLTVSSAKNLRLFAGTGSKIFIKSGSLAEAPLRNPNGLGSLDGATEYSTKIIKKDIKPISDADVIKFIETLDIKSFKYKSDNRPGVSLMIEDEISDNIPFKEELFHRMDEALIYEKFEDIPEFLKEYVNTPNFKKEGEKYIFKPMVYNVGHLLSLSLAVNKNLNSRVKQLEADMVAIKTKLGI